ncbi:MAG: dTMP kinase [Candidatus Omnitrophica bacterium]|nr:dTMP kinase [Candidatus Omnitrophota bacterium]MBU4473103.1 dTMP kinase [Candidatus Omnitrophota bacterium]
MKKGIFITFEGSEGCGKSTQSRLLYGYLKRKGHSVIYLREPGGTKISEKIRKVLLDPDNKSMSAIAETFLYMAARAQVVSEVIRPALEKGRIVICDRFLDSTLAYQGYGLGIDIRSIKLMGDFVTGNIKPDLTIFLDLPVKKGLKVCGRVKDRIEKRPLDYHMRVRRGYLRLAAFQPRRIKVIKLDKNKSVTQDKIRKLISGWIQKFKH